MLFALVLSAASVESLFYLVISTEREIHFTSRKMVESPSPSSGKTSSSDSSPTPATQRDGEAPTQPATASPGGTAATPTASAPAVSPAPAIASINDVPHSMGLVNQGSTCYLNSLLQLLFHTGSFRSSVYRMASTCAEGAEEQAAANDASPIPQALQELFFQMQERKTAPTTKGLTNAFGWDEREVFVQHDIQELAAVLRDNLETKMKGSPSEGAINRLFEGRGVTITATLDGSYMSKRSDTFYDIHLPITKCSNIVESVRLLLAKDQLTGDNKYKVEEEGKPPVYKDAETGYQYTRFPPVIFFHLKRFEMDLTSPTLDMKKVNTAFEFSDTVDLREFEFPEEPVDRETLERDAKRADEDPDYFSPHSQAIYDLYGVIVHRGTVHSGHYYSFIRQYNPEQGKFTHWLQYDDDDVTVVDEHAAIDNNFGGFTRQYYNGRDYTVPITHSAYILAYVRRSDAPKILRPTPTDIIPQSVKDELRRVMEIDEVRAKLLAETRTKAKITIVTDRTIRESVAAHTYELISKDERQHGHNAITVDLKKRDPFKVVFDRVGEELAVPSDQIRFWRWGYLVPERVSAYRATTLLQVKYSDSRTIEEVLAEFIADKDKPITYLLYAETRREYLPGTVSSILSAADVVNTTMTSVMSPDDVGKPPERMLQDMAANPHCPRFSPNDPNPSLTLELRQPKILERVDFRSTAPKSQHTGSSESAYVIETFVDKESLHSGKPTQQVVTETVRLPSVEIAASRFQIILPQSEVLTRFVRITRLHKFGSMIEMHISRVFLHSCSPAEPIQVGLPPVSLDKPTILFIKAYNWRTATISYVGSIIPERTNILGANRFQILHLLNVPQEKYRDTKLLWFDETRPYSVLPLREDADLGTISILSGNIITVQQVPEKVPAAYRFSRADQYYHHVDSRRFVNVRRIDAVGQVAASLQMVSTWQYDEICEAIGNRLNIRPDHLRLYTNKDYYMPSPSTEPVRSDQHRTLEEMLRHGQWSGIDLFFEELSASRSDLESLHRVKVCLVDRTASKVVLPETLVELPPQSTYFCLVNEMLRLAAEALSGSSSTSVKGATSSGEGGPPAGEPHADPEALKDVLTCSSYVFLGIYDHIIHRSVEIDMTAGRQGSSVLDKTYEAYWQFEIRPLPDGPIRPESTFARYHCCRGDYTNASGATYFGSPFLIDLPHDATISDARNALIQAAGIAEDDLRKDPYDVMMVTTAPLHFPKWEDEVSLYWKFTENRSRRPPSLLINYKRPKEKPGSRYVAQNDPKLTLEKKKH